MKKKHGVHWQKPMTVTLVLIFLMTLGSFFLTGYINRIEEDRSFERLHEETEALAQDIEAYAQSDREQLEMISTVVAGYQDLTSSDLWGILDSYDTVGMMSRLELLLPDNSVLIKGGRRVDVDGFLSFDQLKDLGAHITDRELDVTGEDQEERYVLRHYVPVNRDGETIAMLYGVVELGSLPEKLMGEPYGGEAAIYIIDGETGDFLVDTWHNEPGNIWDLGERPMARGYNHEQLKQGLIDGETGYVVFVSKTIGKYLYFYYEPLQINNWRIALSVSEDVVFARANVIKEILNAFLLFEGLCFVLYFLWMFRYVRRETGEKQSQLDAINYMYDVGNLLFNAHEKQEHIKTALEKIARITSAEKAGFWAMAKRDVDSLFLWEKDAHENTDRSGAEWRESLSCVLKYFEEGNSQFEAADREEIRKICPNQGADSLYNFMAVSVEDMDGSICGILFACNMPEGKMNPTLLKSVSFSFSMFSHNMRIYNAAKELGESDTLLGLYNRNRYEMDLPEYLKRYNKSLACVYMDINGLHELNNQKGHDAGDEMLKATARTLREKFGDQYTYRIGGDEFLAFCVDVDEETVNQLSRDVAEQLEKEGVHISIGVQWQEKVTSMSAIIKEAEKKMYAAKKKYYEKKKNDWREGDHRRLEG